MPCGFGMAHSEHYLKEHTMATIASMMDLAPASNLNVVVEVKDLLKAVEVLGNAAHGDPGEPRQDLATLAVAMGVSPKGKAPKDLAQRIAKAMRGMEQEALSDALSQLPKHLQEVLGVEVEPSTVEVESEQTQELPVLAAEPATGNPVTEEQALAELAAKQAAEEAEKARINAERDAVIAEERARRDAEKEAAKKAEPEFPKVFTTSWGKVTMTKPTSGTLLMADMKHPVGITGEAGFEKPILEMDAKQAQAFVAKTREKVAMSGRESSLRQIVRSINDQMKGGSVRQQRLPAKFDEEFALITGVLFNAINTGDRQVAEGAVYKLLCVAAMEFGGAALIDLPVIKRIALEWGVNVPSKKGTNMPEQKKSEPQKPAGNSPAPVVESTPANAPASEPVKGKESDMSQQTQSAPVSTTETRLLEALDRDVGPTGPEYTETVIRAVEAKADATEEKKEGQPAASAPTQPNNLLGSWTALLALPEGGRKLAVEAFAVDFFVGTPSKLETHKKNLVRAVRAASLNNGNFEAAKKAFKNANPGLKAWCVERFEAVKAVLGQMIVSALDKGATYVAPVQDSPAPVSNSEPANEPAKEEKTMSQQTKPVSPAPLNAKSRRALRAHLANAKKNEEAAPEPAGPVVETVLEGTVEGEPTKEAPKDELKAEKKAADKAKKEAEKANKKPTAKVVSRVKVAAMQADTVVRRFCAPLVPADKESVKRLLTELKAACGEADTLVNPTSVAETVATLRNTMLQSVAMKDSTAEKFWTAAKAAQAGITDDRLASMRNKATADWSAHQSDYIATDIEEGLNAYFAGDEGLAKKQALHAAFQYLLGRNEAVQKEGRFVTEAGAKLIAEKAKVWKEQALKIEDIAKKALSLKGLSIFSSVKDDKSYMALRRQLSNTKIVLERAKKADLKDEVMLKDLQARVDGLQAIGDAVDGVLRGTFELATWDLWATGTTSGRDMRILIEAILDTKFASTVKDEAGKDVVRIDGIAGSSEELRGTIGKLAAALLVKVVYENVQLDLEVREIMEQIKSPKLLQQAAAKPGFRGYARTVAWAIYAGGVYVTLKTAAVLNWAAAPVKASYYALKAVGLYGFGFIAEDKEGNKKAVTEAFATAKDLIVGFVVVPKDLVVNGAKTVWATVSGWFTGEKKADAVVADAGTKTPDQGEKEEGVMNTISEKSKSVVNYVKEHKLETAGVVVGGVAGGVVAGVVMGAGALGIAGAVVGGAAVVAGAIWAVKKIGSWFSGRKAEAKAETVKIAQGASAKCDKPDTKSGEPAAVANGCGPVTAAKVEAPTAAPVAAVASN